MAENRGTKAFETTIEEYLKGMADKDPLFADRYRKEEKNIHDCCNYIIGEVQKSGKCGFTDEEIFGLAVHYYDEDGIEKPKEIGAKVVVNHVVELTEEEKKEAREEAKKKLIQEQIQSMKKKTAPKPKAKDEKAPDMFDLFGDM